MERTTAGGSTQPPVRETFDLVNAGPRHRFTVIGNGLPLIAHNCGYQCGWAKFQHSLRTAAKREGFVLPDTGDTFCANVVNTYRRKRDRITRNWYVAHEALTPLAFGQTSQLGPYLVRDGVIELPEGHRMYYPNLRTQEKKGDGEQGFEWVYDRFKKGRKTTEKMYGGKLVENITQRVARLFITAAMRRLDEIRYSNGERVFHIVFTVHDEIVVLYHESLDDQYVTENLTWAMTQEMPWAPGMPVACEVGIGRNYSETK